MTNTTENRKFYVLKISENIGEYEANSKILVQVKPDDLDQYVEDLLKDSWRGEADYNEEDQVFENGEVSWYLTEAIEVKDDVAQYLIQMNILNLL
ncbi:hypothetical protein XaC1_8 [Xanthomonas phage XaC1]|nr:hypothetical protein XaC1_8 [Xanthomonas phage XaC1]